MIQTTEGTTPQTDPLTEWIEYVADLFVDAFTGAAEGPEREHELTEDCWCQPTVEHVEPEPPLSVGDEVVIDDQYFGFVVISEPDALGRLCVRVERPLVGYAPWQDDELVLLRRDRLSWFAAREVEPPEPTVTVHLPDDSLLYLDMDLFGSTLIDDSVPATLSMSVTVAAAFAEQIDQAILTPSQGAA